MAKRRKRLNSRRRLEKVAPLADCDESHFLFLLLILFAASGCSALIYEVVWYQLLQLIIGSTAVSMAVLLATYMGGLCLGSIASPRILAKRHHLSPFRAYALVESGIGICGLLVLFGMPFVARIYIAAVGHGYPAILLRALISAPCLLLPTFLMGSSLPVLARSVRTTPKGVSSLGLLYGSNTIGAVFGCLLGGFYLLRVFNIETVTYVAVTINAAIAFVSFLLPAKEMYKPPLDDAEELSDSGRSNCWPFHVAIALSGASALGAEVVWTRLLGLMLGPTAYTFSIILAVFLVGLGIGSAVGSRISRLMRRETAMGYCQLLLTVAIAWTAFALSRLLPYWSIGAKELANPWITFGTDLMGVIWAILPPTFLWGASFPLTLAAVASLDDDPARLVGTVYASNTGGAILGALVFSLLLIPGIGTAQSERLLVMLSVASALFALVPFVWTVHTKVSRILLSASVLIATLLAWGLPAIPPGVIAFGRFFKSWRDNSSNISQVVYVGEGLNSSIAISRWNDHVVQFHVSGKVEASTAPSDMRLQRMLGLLPALLHPKPRSVLVVGFGAGVTAGSFVVYPDVQRIVICEIEPLIPPIAARYFGKENYGVLNDRRTKVVYDDARHYILTTPEKFDIITSDPIHPWVKGSATLYSKEYFTLVRDHLNPGGIVTQWVPLYQSDVDTVKSEIATFFDVFPNGTIWANEVAGRGYDMVLLGRTNLPKIDVEDLQRRLDEPKYSEVARSLRDVGLGSAVDLIGTYAGRYSNLKSWLKGAEINRDRNLRLQYLAGMALNVRNEELIYDQILNRRQFAPDLITGSSQQLEALQAKLSASHGLFGSASQLSGESSAIQYPTDSPVTGGEHPILRESEVVELASFQKLMTGRSKSRAELIHDLTNQWITRAEAGKANYPPPTQEEINRAFDELIEEFPSPLQFQDRCVEVGLNDQSVRRMLERQLYLSSYLDHRFRPEAKVTNRQIEVFFRDDFAPQLKARGEAVPPIADAEGKISELLLQRAINVHAARWLDTKRNHLKIEFIADGETR